MSLLNAYMASDHALIAVDTLSSAPTCQLAPTESIVDALRRLDSGTYSSKFCYLPHINAVIAHRGDLLLASIASHSLHMVLPQSVDAAVEAMPQLLAQAYSDAMRIRRLQFAGNYQFQGSELVLFGWSDALSRMFAVRWVRWPHSNGFQGTPVGMALLLPDAEWEQPPEAPDTAERMEAIAHDQVAYVRQKHHGYNCGGRLLLAELTRDSLSVRTVCDLEKD